MARFIASNRARNPLAAHRCFVVDDRSCPNSIDRLYTALVAGIDEVEVPLMIKTIRDENTNQYPKATFCVQLAHSI